MKFLTDLILKDIDGLKWTLAQELVWCSSDGNKIKVPAGFVTDLATMPIKILRASGDWNRAAVVHDYLYSNAGSLTRKQVDLYFKEALADCHVGKVTSYVMYAAVRVYGIYRWRCN